jgi:hypothetical protein
MQEVKTLPAFLFENGKIKLHFCKTEFFVYLWTVTAYNDMSVGAFP